MDIVRHIFADTDDLALGGAFYIELLFAGLTMEDTFSHCDGAAGMSTHVGMHSITGIDVC